MRQARCLPSPFPSHSDGIYLTPVLWHEPGWSDSTVWPGDTFVRGCNVAAGPKWPPRATAKGHVSYHGGLHLQLLRRHETCDGQPFASARSWTGGGLTHHCPLLAMIMFLSCRLHGSCFVATGWLTSSWCCRGRSTISEPLVEPPLGMQLESAAEVPPPVAKIQVEGLSVASDSVPDTQQQPGSAASGALHSQPPPVLVSFIPRRPHAWLSTLVPEDQSTSCVTSSKVESLRARA